MTNWLACRAIIAAIILGGAGSYATGVASPLGAGQLQSLPDAMTGAWGWSGKSCANANDDGRVRVRPRSVEFFASAYRLIGIVIGSSGAVRATATVSEEGESNSTLGTIHLTLVKTNRLRIHTGSGLAHIYVRCSSPH